jgi:hypothetical protein
MSQAEDPSKVLPSTERVQVLLAQYRECSAAHIHFMSLIWQVPAVTVTASGALIAVTYGYDVPNGVRALITGLGALFLFAMTLAVERYRMFQLRRRRDLVEIEKDLAPLARMIAWDGRQIVDEIRRGEFKPTGVYLYRWEGFKVLRAMMYAATFALLVLAAVALAHAAS